MINWFKFFSPSDINQKFVQLEEAVDELPDFTVIVPISLPPAEVSRLGQWSRANVRSDVMVSIRVDPQAVGGCMVVWQGMYLDMSLRYFFTKNRDALTELVHSEQK